MLGEFSFLVGGGGGFIRGIRFEAVLSLRSITSLQVVPGGDFPHSCLTSRFSKVFQGGRLVLGGVGRYTTIYLAL